MNDFIVWVVEETDYEGVFTMAICADEATATAIRDFLKLDYTSKTDPSVYTRKVNVLTSLEEFKEEEGL